jgi:hypothetical protein
MMIWTDKTILVKHDPNIENRIGGTVRVRRARIMDAVAMETAKMLKC